MTGSDVPSLGMGIGRDFSGGSSIFPIFLTGGASSPDDRPAAGVAADNVVSAIKTLLSLDWALIAEKINKIVIRGKMYFMTVPWRRVKRGKA